MEEELFTFHFETHLPVPREEAFEWFEKPGAFERLLPPFFPIQVSHPVPSLEVGAQVHFKYLVFGKEAFNCIHEITEVEKGVSFVDKQIKGPFTSWKHFRKFWEKDKHHTVIEEIVQYKLPIDSILGQMMNTPIAKRLSRLFTYREEILKRDLLFLREYPKKPLHILMTGSSGLIGSALTPLLKTMGHIVTPIQRQLSADEEGIFWDIENQKIDQELLENHDAVIHLAGENIGQYWSDPVKEKIYKSRVYSTRLLAQTLSKLKNPPSTFISASGLHLYQPGKESYQTGFLEQVAKDWEAEAHNLEKIMRVVLVRTGTVLSPRGGMLKKLLPLYKSALGMKIGQGDTKMSWISIDDLVYLYAHILMTKSIEGPINATSPYPITQAEFSQTLARLLKRPQFLTLPAGLLKTLGGQMAKEVMLSDLAIKPSKLLDEDYPFQYPHLSGCLKHVLGLL